MPTLIPARSVCVLAVLALAAGVWGFEPPPAPPHPRTTHHYFSKQAHVHTVAWGYAGATGPEHWGALAPEYRVARTGRRQSPIDIDAAATVPRDQPALAFDYQVERISSFHNGHTIQHDDQPGSFLHVGDDRYALEQFHVHTPSEHTLEGRRFPMEIHFVHKSPEGRVAVVGVLVEADPAGTVNIPPYYSLPERAGEESVSTGRQNPADYLPPSRGYFEYGGSFTTPPCTEGVRWIVLREPVRARPEMVARFQAILKGNNRPLQPRDGRQITAVAPSP